MHPMLVKGEQERFRLARNDVSRTTLESKHTVNTNLRSNTTPSDRASHLMSVATVR